MYYSQDTYVLPPEAIKGKCEVMKKNDMPLCHDYPILDHIFFCELFYDSSNGSLKPVYIFQLILFIVFKDNIVGSDMKLNCCHVTVALRYGAEVLYY